MNKLKINAIKRIIKGAKGDRLRGVWIDSDGRTVATDSYRIIRTKESVPDDIPRASGVDVSRFFNDPRGYDVILPHIKELQRIIKEARQNRIKPVYDFGECLPRVNAKYLLDILRIFPDAVAYRSAGNCKNKAIFFESHSGDALLLPIYKAEKKDAEQ